MLQDIVSTHLLLDSPGGMKDLDNRTPICIVVDHGLHPDLFCALSHLGLPNQEVTNSFYWYLASCLPGNFEK